MELHRHDDHQFQLSALGKCVVVTKEALRTRDRVRRALGVRDDQLHPRDGAAWAAAVEEQVAMLAEVAA